MIIDYSRLESNTEIAPSIFEAVFGCVRELPDIEPGQFINVYPKNPCLSLPRPISVCDAGSGRLKIVYRVVGKGTTELSGCKPGEGVKVMLPLGNGFDLTRAHGKRCVLVGGGLGVAPLLYLAKRLMLAGADSISIYLGFADTTFLLNEFSDCCDNVYVSTETGSHGEKGNVLDLVRKHDKDGETYFCCGPAPMLKALSGYISARNAEGQVSLEQRMACGFGSCVGCAVKIKRQSDADWQYLKVCKDGPVFDCGEVLWD